MHMWDEVWHQFTGILIRLSAAYGVGWLLWLPLGIRKAGWAVTCFGKMALGATGISAGMAIFYTNGITVCWALAGLYLAAVWFRQKSARWAWSESRIEWRGIGWAALASMGYLAAQWLTNDYFNGSVVHLGDEDYGIYAQAAEYLKQAEVERPSPWYELFAEAATGKPEPYHYPDLWLATWCLPSALPSLAGYLYVFIPLACGVCFLANLAVLHTFFPGNAKGTWIAFFSLFFPAMFFGFDFSVGYQFPVFILSKLVLAYWILSAALLLWRIEFKSLCFLVMGGLPVVNIIYSPVVLVTFLALIVLEKPWESFKLKKIGPKLVIPIITAAFLLSFYRLADEWLSISKNFQFSWLEYFWRTARGWIAAVVKNLVFVWPVYLMAFWIRFNQRRFWKNENRALEWLGVVIMSGIFVKGIFNANFEVNQFLMMVVIPSLTLGFIVLSGVFIEKKNFYPNLLEKRNSSRGRQGIILVVLFWSFFQITLTRSTVQNFVGRKFLENSAVALQEKNPIGVAISNPVNENVFSTDPRMCLFGNFLGMVGKAYWVNSLSVPSGESEIRFPERKGAILRSPFYRYIQAQKQSGLFKDYEQACLDFIHAYNIDYLVVEKGAPIPEKIQTCANQTLEDPLSGTRLIILNRPCGS